MNQKKEQKIIVLTTLSDADRKIILQGMKLASIFKKELCLNYLLKKKEKITRDYATRKLNEYLEDIKNDISVLKSSILITEGKLKKLPSDLADNHEAIMLIASSVNFRSYSHAITDSPVPFLFVNPAYPVSAYQKVILPIDIRKENDDAALWCSWFGKFGKSEITVIAANDKSADSQHRVMQNLKLVKSLFQKSDVSHRIIKGIRSSFYNSFEAAEFALTSDAGLLVLTGSSTITPLDWLIGLPERKIISKDFKSPVLLLNPRRDNYIMCN